MAVLAVGSHMDEFNYLFVNYKLLVSVLIKTQEINSEVCSAGVKGGVADKTLFFLLYFLEYYFSFNFCARHIVFPLEIFLQIILRKGCCRQRAFRSNLRPLDRLPVGRLR